MATSAKIKKVAKELILAINTELGHSVSDVRVTESLFSPKCLLIEHWPAAEIIALYILCIVTYGLGLLALNYVKDVSPSVFKKMFEVLKKKLMYNNKTAFS